MPTPRFIWFLLLLVSTPTALLAEDVVRVPEDAATLTAAIASVPDGGTIDVAGGTYSSPAPSGFQILNLGKSFTMRGRAGETAILDGGFARPVLFLKDMPNEWVVFENLTFRNGLSTTANQAGGATVLNGKATFVGCVFEANESDVDTSGGGGTTVADGSLALFDDCTWQNNSASGTGGGMRLGGQSTAWVHASQFLTNRTNLPGHRSSSTGGAIKVRDSTLRVANSRFDGNEAGFSGGAIHSSGDWAEGSDVTVVNSTFVDNVAEPTTGALSTSGGALHAEDLVTLRVYSSRFLTNRADGGGAISGLRPIVEVHDSVFRGNQATGVGSRALGGAIALSSNDTTADGTDNRRSAQLTVTDSLIQGRYQTVGVVAKIGGGIHVNGDTQRNYGFNGVPQAGTTAANRATVTIDNVIFADLDVEVSGGGTGLGGAMNFSLTDLTLTDSLVIDCDTTGTNATAGGLRLAVESAGGVTGTTFANNTAEDFGAALTVDGSDVDVTGCNFFANEITEPASYSFGAAIFSGVNDDAFNVPGLDFDAAGTVSGSVFSSNVGLAIYEKDVAGTPDNLVQYVDNDFFESSFGADVFLNQQTAVQDVAELNTLMLNGINKSPGVVNTAPGSAPVLGALLAAPPRILDTVAADDPETETESFLGYAWSGAGSAELDGNPVGATGVSASTVGAHSLVVVPPESFDATITQGATPAASFTATPASISGGGSSSLSWSTTAGTFLGSSIDQNVASGGAASGSPLITPAATTTYALCILTEEGGVTAQATVFVDEGPVGLIFSDGFESGATSAWSSTIP